MAVLAVINALVLLVLLWAVALNLRSIVLDDNAERREKKAAMLFIQIITLILWGVTLCLSVLSLLQIMQLRKTSLPYRPPMPTAMEAVLHSEHWQDPA